MSNVSAESCTASVPLKNNFESYPVCDVTHGQILIQSAPPIKGRRVIGPWCFLDRFGQIRFKDGVPMDVAAQLHMGLPTVS